jgi:hypothetical protein
MKHRLCLVLLAFAFIGAAGAPDIGLEFSGVLGSAKDLRVALTNTASGSTRWARVGSTVAGYTISEYDSKADVVVLTKDGQRIRLALKQRKTPSADAKIQPEVERAILNNLRQLAAAADQYYLEQGKKSTTYDELVGADKYVRTMNPINGENYRALRFEQGVRLIVTTSSGHSVSYEP